MVSDIQNIGVVVDLYRATITHDNIYGDENRSYPSTPTKIRVIYYREQGGYDLTKQGKISTEEWKVYADPADNLKEGDKLVIDGSSYLIRFVVPHNIGEAGVWHEVMIFKSEDVS